MSRITASLKSLGNKVTGLFGGKAKDAGKVIKEACAGTKENAFQKKACEKYDNTKDDTSDAIVKGMKKAEDAADSIKKSAKSM